MKTSITVIIYVALALLVPVISGCSVASLDAEETPPVTHLPESEKRYLDISLDGKVGWQSDSKGIIPIPDLKVTMISAEGVRTDSARTNGNGRFLIEHKRVPVGYYWEKHIYVEICDDREMDDTDGKPRYKTRRILKQIDAAPNNQAFLTMDDIVMEKVENGMAENNSTLWIIR